MQSQTMKRSFVFFLVLAVGLAMSFALSADPSSAAVKAKKVTLKATSQTLDIGETVTITAKVKPAKAVKKVKWTITKGEEFATLTNVTATSVDVEGVSEGKVTIKAKAKKGKAKKTITLKVVVPKVLKKYGITGYYKKGISNINTVPLDKALTVNVWNPGPREFEAGETADINGNYTSLVDTDGNKKADTVNVVKFADGQKYWDANAAWVPGVGAATVPNVISDEVGQAMFGADCRIPMGERLLTEFGLGDWSGTTDWANLENGGYWENNYVDFHNLTSDDTLTMLTGFRTDLQPSGSLCVMCSAKTVLDWYGQRGDLSEIDLALLRGNDQTEKRGTSLTQTIQVFKKLGELGLTCEWDMESYNDFNGAPMESDWVLAQLKKGHPIIVISNSYGPHGQVIIGYDTMGTDDTLDDVCIMMDPYDTTDQNNDGYIIQPFERLQYSLLTWPDEPLATGCKYIAVWPKDPSLWDDAYKPVMGEGLPDDTANVGNFKGEMKLDYGNTAADIQSFYPNDPDETLGDNGLGGAAAGGYENSGNHDNSPYFTMKDYYNMKDGDGNTKTLRILENFKTIQQSTWWSCGMASALMNIEWFGKNEIRTADTDPGKGFKETDVSLGTHRQGGVNGGTTRAGMKEVFQYMSDQYGQKWTVFTNEDMVDPEGNPDPEGEWEEDYIGPYCLQAGDAYEDWYGLIPYLIDNGIPMMIGSDEWGGHWQVIIGYDGMGTEATQDDVLIIADPYDTTDHNQDGYVIKGFERLVYGWGSAFEAWEVGKTKGVIDNCDFVVAFPTEGNEKVIEELGLN